MRQLGLRCKCRRVVRKFQKVDGTYLSSRLRPGSATAYGIWEPEGINGSSGTEILPKADYLACHNVKQYSKVVSEESKPEQ